MNYLAIDTSGKNLTLVLNENGKIHKYFDANCGVAHSVSLLPEIEKILEKASFSVSDCDFIACVVGAGSFTGIRIGVSTAKALAFAYGKKVLSITSFDCLAYNKKDGKRLAVIDAKHNGFFVCGYDGDDITFPPSYVMRDTLDALAMEYLLICDTEIDLPYEKADIVSGLISAIEVKNDNACENINSLVPLYCRKSQAEEGR